MEVIEPPGKETYTCYFVALDPEACEGRQNQHRCKACDSVFSQNIRSGFENLKKHLRAQHPEWIEKVNEHIRGSVPRGMMDNWLGTSTNKAKTIYEWIEWIVFDNLPFQFCEKETTRKKAKLASISRNTLKKYMALLQEEIKQIIRARLPKSFGLIIDGWSDTSYHFSAIFATFTEGEWDEVVEFLLSCNIAEDFDEETDFDENLPENLKQFGFTAAGWFDILRDVLLDYGKEVDVDTFQELIDFICGDNCSVNKKLATDSGIHYKLLHFLRYFKLISI
jgi:hypothetical protein